MPDFNRLVAKKKKEAIADNPALAFISQPDEPAGHPSGGEAGADHSQQAAGGNLRPAQARAAQGREAKSRRLQLLLTPSLYEEIRGRAEAEGLSVNETIAALLRKALDE